MEIINPATPAQAAIPGGSGAGQSTPSTPPTPPQKGDQGGQQEGTVTISAKEFADLQRDKARLIAFQKRASFEKPRSNFTPSENDDPEIIDVLHKEQERSKKLESDFRDERIKNGVRGILDKEEYKELPKVARDLILKNPALLSNAATAEEALIDIEEFIGGQMADYKAGLAQGGVNQQKGGTGQPQSPSGHETPPIVNAANPAPVDVNALEDVEKLEGSNKSRGILRNLLRKQRQGKGV